MRISPFNAAGKRANLFVSCDVMPDIERILISRSGMRISVSIRTAPAEPADSILIRRPPQSVSHIIRPVVVQCQNERSQFQNKDKAMQMLKAKLLDSAPAGAGGEGESGIRGEVSEIGWGHQIRSMCCNLILW